MKIRQSSPEGSVARGRSSRGELYVPASARNYRSLIPRAVVAAPGLAAGLEDLLDLAFIKGACQRLVLGGKDFSGQCEGKLVNTAYKTGRTGFVFSARDSAIVTFSGIDTPAQGDRAKSILDVVLVAAVSSETDPTKVKSKTLPATGTCTYTNPNKGPSHVECNASTKEGSFTASFLSDGSPPDIQYFK